MWFKRNDGQLFEAAEDSASFQMMSKSGEFKEVIETVETPDGEKMALTGKPELWKDNESTSESEQSSLEGAGATGDSGQSGPAKRGRAGKRNKADGS